MRLLGLGLSCLLLALLTSPLMAQSETAGGEATVLFDIRMNKIVSSPLGKALDLKGKMSQMPDDGPDMTKLERIFGASTAPKDMNAMQAMQMGNMDGIDFFVRFQFVDGDGAKSMMKKPMEDNDGVVEKDGKKFYKAPSQSGAPEGVMIYQVDEKTVEIGSEKFLFRSNPKPFTANINSAFGKTSDSAIRLVLDLEANAPLVDGMIEQATKQAGGNPMAGQMMGVLKKMKTMAIGVDLNGKNLVELQAMGKSKEAAEEVKGAMDSMKFLAKTGLNGQAQQLQQMMPDASKLMKGVAEGMDVTAKGDMVSFIITKPEGMEKVVKSLAEQFMMGPGGFGPPNDF